MQKKHHLELSLIQYYFLFDKNVWLLDVDIFPSFQLDWSVFMIFSVSVQGNYPISLYFPSTFVSKCKDVIDKYYQIQKCCCCHIHAVSLSVKKSFQNMDSYWMEKSNSALSLAESKSKESERESRARGGGDQLILLSPDLKADSRNGCQD